MATIYQMHLQDEPFALILSGRKTIEMRLNKPGRENICKDDIIVFTNNNGDKIKTVVLGVHKFPSFKALYDSFDKTKLGYLPNQFANPKDMLKYYSIENIEKYGVLAIEIKVIDK